MPLPHVTSLRSAWLCGVGRPWAPGRSRGSCSGCGGARVRVRSSSSKNQNVDNY